MLKKPGIATDPQKGGEGRGEGWGYVVEIVAKLATFKRCWGGRCDFFA
jgi:hypothetical protein